MQTPSATISPILLAKLQKLSPTQQQQIEDYIDFILQKYKKESEEFLSKGIKRVLGLNKGKMSMTEDFDEPLSFNDLYI